MDFSNLFNNQIFSTVIVQAGGLSIKLIDIVNLTLIFFALSATISVLNRIATRNIKGDDRDSAIRRDSVHQIIRYIVYVVGVILGLSAIGIDLTLLATALAALSVGIGFGLQQLFLDFMSGIILLFDDSIGPGDILSFNGESAKVVRIGLRTSILETVRSVSIIVPNSELTKAQVYNMSQNKRSTSFIVRVGVDYGADPKHVENTLVDIAVNNDQVMDNPEPFVRIADFGDSAVIYDLIIWTREFYQIEDLKSNLRKEILTRFHSENITIPFPQRVIHTE